MGKISNLKIALILSFIFFILGVLTLKDYGINWDTINHLPRGQAYLHYFLTGKKDYSDLAPYPKNSYQDPSTLTPQTSGRSFYQSDETTFDYFIQYGGEGHPPLSDILSALFNRVLYGRLHLIDDIDAYHVYGVFLAALLIGLVFYWVSESYGSFAGIIASLSLAMYPLFWSESHFNTEKDVPETVYWSFFLFCVFNGVKKKSVKWILLSGVFFGLALGTKFNILFSIFAILPWIIFYFVRNREKVFSKFSIKIFIASIFAFIIGSLLFFITFPNLWADPITGMSKVIGFYKLLGIAGATFDPRFILFNKINLYPLTWIITTTPPVVLILVLIGIIFAIVNFRKEKSGLLLLFLMWLMVPIGRVTWSGADIYGGIRQLMEYVPALCILAGIGAGVIFKSRFSKLLCVVLAFIFLIFPLIKTHPNENAYFNLFVGGLNGAKEKNIPSWGNTFGSAYRGAADWINKNVEYGADVNLANELAPNVPHIWIRPDINFSALTRSGYLRKGEYSFTLNYQGTNLRSYYDMYLDKFLVPVYQEKVDGVAVVTVWKNDDSHLKEPWNESKLSGVKFSKSKNNIKFDLGAEYKISRLEISYTQKNCSKLTEGIFQLSKDGQTWETLPDKLPDSWTIAVLGEQPKNGHFIEPFTGENVRYVDFNFSPNDTCMVKNLSSFSFFYLK